MWKWKLKLKSVKDFHEAPDEFTFYTFFYAHTQKKCRSTTLRPKKKKTNLHFSKQIFNMWDGSTAPETNVQMTESWGNVPNARRDPEGPLCNSISHLRVRVFVCFEFSLISEDSRQGHKDRKTQRRGDEEICLLANLRLSPFKLVPLRCVRRYCTSTLYTTHLQSVVTAKSTFQFIWGASLRWNSGHINRQTSFVWSFR